VNWRPATPADTEALLQLSREPMPGNIQLVWGFRTLAAPPGCSDLRVFLAETNGQPLALAMTWVWPGGARYLASLRLSSAMRGRPGREHWTQGYRDVLDGTDFAWTSIGRDNLPARRLLERGASWLPRYVPRLDLTTWFLPLPRGTGHTPGAELAARGLTPRPHRHAAIVGGHGFSYAIARALRLLPPPGQELRLLSATTPVSTRDLRGYDGLLVVFPADKAPHPPFRCGTWHSTIYQVQWNPDLPPAPLPALEAAWL